jgi:predicted AAA+ superfamily ATPase
MAQSASTILDFSKIATKAKVARTSCIRFIEILEDTLVGARVEVFKEAEKADTIKHPKFYFFDPGVLNGLLGNFIASKDRMGLLFEHVVFAQLRNSAMALDKNLEIYYFRTRNDVEVDFVIKWNHKVYAIEVKSGTIAKSDLSNLKIFKSYFPKVHKCFAVSPQEKKRTLDGIIICNLVEMLKELKM